MEKRWTFVVGSLSKHKVEATRAVGIVLGLRGNVFGVETASGVRDQPVGIDETYRGAVNRALAARADYPDAVGVGIENGIVVLGHNGSRHAIDLAIVVILMPDGKESVCISQGIAFPTECLEEAERMGFETTTVGAIFANRFGGDATDPHAKLSAGRTSRRKLLAETLAQAFITAFSDAE